MDKQVARQKAFDRYTKLKTSLRYFLLAKIADPAWRKAYDAFEEIMRYECDSEGNLRMRKNGIDPALLHQLSVAQHVRALMPLLQFPIETLIAALFHDHMEDHALTFEYLKNKYGELCAGAILKLSKKYANTKIPMEEYFLGVRDCPISSIVKLIDRINNLGTMNGVFSSEKQQSYIDEVLKYFMPMLKYARRVFPDQEGAYEVLKLHMMDIVRSVQARLDEQAGQDPIVQPS